MRQSMHSPGWSRSTRLLALGAGLLLLAGCVTPYSYVQGGYGGGYYTSDGPASGYYYAAPAGYGYYGGGYGYAYGPPVGLTIGISNGWPGYYGYGGYGYRHGYHGSGGHWNHQSGGGYHHGGWNGSGSHGWSSSPGGHVMQPHTGTRPMPAPAVRAPARGPRTPSEKRR